MQGKINRGRHTDHQAGRLSIRTNQCPPPSSPTACQLSCWITLPILHQTSYCLQTAGITGAKPTQHFYRLNSLLIAKAPFSKHNAIKKFYYHDCINNIHAVATECLNRLPSRHICLRHYQLDVLCVNSRLINLDDTCQVVVTTVQTRNVGQCPT